MNVRIAAFLTLLLAVVACSSSVKYATTPYVVPTQTAKPTIALGDIKNPDGITQLHRQEMCVQSYGLWLRSSPEFSDDNKVMALPQGTRLIVVSPGLWTRVYLAAMDEYGWVRSDYLGECQ